MKNIVTRLKEYLDFKGISVSVAEKTIGISNASLSKPFNNKTSIKTDTLESFLNSYSEISSEWLLTGKGKMLKKAINENIVNEPIENYGLDYKEMYLDAKYTIEVQKKYIESLELQLNTKRKAG